MEETIFSLLEKIENECSLVRHACVVTEADLIKSSNRIENYIKEIKSLIKEEISLES